MATFSDIFDWLNQGAQGDIPGTGPDQSMVKQPPPSGAVQMPDITGPSPNQYPTVPQPQPQNIADQPLPGKKPGPVATPGSIGGLQPATPGDYAGDIPPPLRAHYQALVQSGLPPAVAHSILTQPTTGEGEVSLQAALGGSWPQNYRGWEKDAQGNMQNWGRNPLEQHMWDAYHTRQQNLPTEEGHTPGDDDDLGFTRLPSGQYVPWSQPNPAGQSDEMDRMMQAWGIGSPTRRSAPPASNLDILQWLGIQ